MERAVFNITFSRIALQVWIMILIPLSFVLIPLLLLLNFDIAEWLFIIIIFIFVFLSWLCTVKLIALCTRKGIIEADEEGLQLTFKDKSIFYDQFSNAKISWADVRKMAYNYDINHDIPFIVFRFQNNPGTYICMQEEGSKGMGESNWPMWLALDQYAGAYEHMHREHRMSRTNFLDTWLFKILLWALTLIFVMLVVYKLTFTGQAPAWYQILRLLIFLVPAHFLNLVHRRKITESTPGRNSDTNNPK